MKKLIILAVLFSTSAFADTCAKNLTNVFTAAQAKALCSVYSPSGAFTVGGQLTATGLQFPAANYETVAAAGSTTSDAAALSATKHVHQVTGADGTKGVKFGTSVAGQFEVILNGTAGVLKIYAATGGTVNGGAVDAAFSALTGIKPILCYSTAVNTWICA